MITIEKFFKNLSLLEEKYKIKIDLKKDAIIDIEHLESLWYGGVIGTVSYKNYRLSIEARGDIKLLGRYNGEEFRFKDKSCHGDAYNILPKTINDKTFYKYCTRELPEDTDSSDYIYIDDMNWFDACIEDSNGDWIDSLTDLDGNLLDCFSEDIITMFIAYIDANY